MIIETEITEEDILSEQLRLASLRGLTVSELYYQMGSGAFAGTILESKLHMLRFLLGDEC